MNVERNVERKERNHKAVLCGLPKEGPGALDRPQQIIMVSLGEAVAWGKQTVERLSDAQKKTAFVLVTEVCEVKVMEIHAAVTPGEYAIADFRKAIEAATTK